MVGYPVRNIIQVQYLIPYSHGTSLWFREQLPSFARKGKPKIKEIEISNSDNISIDISIPLSIYFQIQIIKCSTF